MTHQLDTKQSETKQLELINLRKQYTPKVIPVKNISLSVGQGEFLTLLGPSGCGKSTILRLIAGLEQPTEGKIMLNGRDVTRLGAGDRNIAMVFQSYALYPHMTVYENIASGLKLRKTSKAEIKQRVDDVADFLGLHELMNRKPGQLSGGQRQRVAVARTLVRRPDIFLLDEPLSNLDALLREHVRAELKQLFAAQSTPVVYVTHDQTEAMTLSTKVAVLNNGHLQQLDSPEQIYTNPANQFVAGFIGSPQMNFLQVPIDRGTAIVGNNSIPLPRGVFGTQPSSLSGSPSNSSSSSQLRTESIVLGIRPEHVSIAHPGDENTVNGQVFLVENLGMHNLISVNVPGKFHEPLTIRALVGREHHVRQDDNIALTLPTDVMHWFNVETGDRLQTQQHSVSMDQIRL